jgi:hypothetical protein
MKIRSVEAELFHADGQTDMTKIIVASRNFAVVSIPALFWVFCSWKDLGGQIILLLLTVELADDLGSFSRWGKPTVHFLWTVADVFQ